MVVLVLTMIDAEARSDSDRVRYGGYDDLSEESAPRISAWM
jgi:hypothetical protein